MKRAIFFGSFASGFVGLVLACSSSSNSATPNTDSGADVASEAISDAPIDKARKSAAADYHRTQTTTCGKTRPPSAPGDSGAGDAGKDPCSVDGDCVAGNNGRCVKQKCSYDECYADTDCATGEICLCRDAEELIPDLAFAPGDAKPTNTVCAAAPECKIDNECGSGGFCSPSYDPSTGKFTFHCHVPADECTNNEDCICPNDNNTDLCRFDDSKSHWACYLKDCR
jgi:hypothetical protein